MNEIDEVLKKEYVYTVKTKSGRTKEIRTPIDLFHSHRSCITDCDCQKIAQKIFAELEKLNHFYEFQDCIGKPCNFTKWGKHEPHMMIEMSLKKWRELKQKFGVNEK